jgi:hypothetical protein
LQLGNAGFALVMCDDVLTAVPRNLFDEILGLIAELYRTTSRQQGELFAPRLEARSRAKTMSRCAWIGKFRDRVEQPPNLIGSGRKASDLKIAADRPKVSANWGLRQE